MSTLIELKNVSASYNEDPVLEDVNLSIRAGDFIGVIGPNGGGKTTLLRLILGLIKPVRGEVIYNSKQIKKKQIGYLPQIAEGDNHFPVSVRDVVLSGLMMIKGHTARMSDTDRAKADAVLHDLGISHLRKKSLDRLSGGELQRVYLGRALIASPKLLLLDEPGNFVDTSFEQGFYDKLRELNKDVTIMMVSHDVGTISAYVKSFACVNRKLNYHGSGRITTEQLKAYDCPIQLIAHGDVPHTVLKSH
ncbi:MAG: ABC transporter ATP-binding protein [Bacteroidales bacterium]|jgi:zinc transport system ATP-binding protein|nr:ABC transporter ATP-binding protein [Bacteroidales bacterium]